MDEYPESVFVDSANLLMDQLRRKLEIKMYNWADLYYKMDYLGPAIEAFELTLSDFPGSTFEEEIYYKMIKSAFFYAKRSVPIKQVERFEKMIEIYDQFVEKYPQSRYRREADDWYGQVKRTIGKVKEG
jgi:outer membrane protein assembly factor BamD